MKKISVLGLEFMDYSVKEAMRMVSSFFENSRVDTVCFLSMKSIMDASSNPDLKGWLESMDLLVPVSAEILEAAGTMSRQRTREVQEGKFYSELMNKLSNDKCTIFILADNMDDIEASKGYLRRRSKGASVVGCFAYE